VVQGTLSKPLAGKKETKMSNIPSTTQSLMARQFQQQMPQMQQQPQPTNGLPPALLQMITEAIAAETVRKATQAAQSQVAQATGGPQPTVADSVKSQLQQAGLEAAQQKLAMQGSGHAEMQDKAKGLAAIANQGQNVPQAQAQAPQGPVQMARGGLARIPSNLPQEYAGGGIIAFGEKDGEQQVPEPETNIDDVVMSALVKLGLVGSKKSDDIQRPGLRPDPRMVTAGTAYDKRTPNDQLLAAAAAQQPAAPSVLDRLTPEGVTPVAGVAELAAAKAKAEAAAKAKAEAAATAPPAFRPPVRTAAAVSPLEAPFNKNVQEEMALNPTTVGELARADYATRQQAAYGTEQAALRAARLQDYETAKAAQAKRDAAGEVGWGDRLSALGRHAGYGQWGQAGADISKLQLAQADRVAEGAKGLLGLKQASDAMALADKKEAFGGAETAGNTARTGAAAQKKDATDTVGRILATQGTNAATITAAEIQAAAHVYGAKLAAHAQENASKRADITGLKGEIAAGEAVLKRNSPMAIMLLEPSERLAAIAENGRAHAVMEANRERLAQLTQTKYTPVAAPEAPGLTPEQEAKRKKILGS
jgi:hypothetical protein